MPPQQPPPQFGTTIPGAQAAHPGSLCGETAAPCPVCGGLQCLCRPRFFAGQLLTDGDLRLLDRYILEKNRLHNRFLHGWGVVCGLEVGCSPCAGMVTVGEGYAIDPCGSDVIVCASQTVNVCNLIAQCKKTTTTPDCTAQYFGQQDPCANITEQWVLAIRYQETPSRGVAALRNSRVAASCECGGSGASGCGCQSGGSSSSNGNGSGYSCGSGTSAGSATATSSAPGLLAQCEPTAICEGFTFDVYPKPIPVYGPANPYPGELNLRFLCCVEALFKLLSPPPAQATANQLVQWCCALKQGILNLLASGPVADCTAYATVAAAQCPTPADGQSAADYYLEILFAASGILIDILQRCLCSALMPPCPGPVTDVRVPLATITVNRSPCSLVSVCEWDVRRFVVTWPAVGYWLSGFGYSAGNTQTGAAPSETYLARIRELIDAICCTTLGGAIKPHVAGAGFQAVPMRADRAARSAPAPRETVAGPPSAEEGPPVSVNLPANNQESVQILASSLLQTDRTVDAQTLLLGGIHATDPNGNLYMSDVEMRHPMEFLLANQVFAPVVNGIAPIVASVLTGTAGQSPVAGVAAGQAAQPAAAGGTGGGAGSGTAALRSQVADLQAALKQQQAQIDALTAKLGGS